MRFRLYLQKSKDIMWHEVGEEFEMFVTGGYVTLPPFPSHYYKTGVPMCYYDVEIPNQLVICTRSLKKGKPYFLASSLPGYEPKAGVYAVIFEPSGEFVNLIIIHSGVLESEDVISAMFDLLEIICNCVNMKVGEVREIKIG